ncbi:unnamed protein product [Ectocarpus sp. CCAP 1310/34]|nr:unnamed protein product [Ectocarpus sp. CCAP 1310/34]
MGTTASAKLTAGEERCLTMSDEEEDYDFEYSEEEQEETDVGLENSYYSAKALKAEDPKAAVEAFRAVMAQEEEQGIWGFKALKQMMKLLFKMSAFQEFTDCYTQLLGYTKGAVTQNVGEKGVNSVLDYVSSSNDWALLKGFYEQTLDTLRRVQEHKNNRLWFKCNLKLGHLMYEVGEMGRLQRIIKELLKACEKEGNGDDDDTNAVKRGTQLLEIFSLQILMHSRQRDQKKLREVYERARKITSAVPHPRVVATILECGGKMHMQEREWDQACTAFFQSFKNYDEAGDPERLQVLKYLVMASILHKSEIDPFDSQEAKPYKQDPEIVAMTNLVEAFRNKQIKDFERILKTHRASLMGDPFIKLYIDDILRTMRTQVLLKAIAPYTRVKLPYLAGELNDIPVTDVEDLLVSCILDGKVDGKIDQVNQVVLCGKVCPAAGGPASSEAGAAAAVGSGSGSRARTAVALERWAESLRSLNTNIAAKVDYR